MTFYLKSNYKQIMSSDVDKMTEEINQTLKELSEIYDKDSNDTFISLYYNKDKDNKFLQRRIKVCKSLLKGDNLKNFQKSMDMIEELMKKNLGPHYAIFVSNKNNFQKYIKLPVKLENLLIVDSSPYLRPLARIQDEWESFTLVLINSNNAKIYLVSLGEIKNSKNLSADIMNKHKKGGWSQARFNRLRKGAINEFLSDIIEELKNKSTNQIIIAGPGITKQRFFDMLPLNIKNQVVDIIDIDIDEKDKLLKKSINLISEKEQRKSSEAVQMLYNEILKEGLGVYGIKDTLKAVRNGQLELLIIKKDYKIKGWICENCQIVEKGSKKSCPNCGKKTSEVDILEEILEFAKRTNAEIEFSDNKELEKLGNIGGILRYK